MFTLHCYCIFVIVWNPYGLLMEISLSLIYKSCGCCFVGGYLHIYNVTLIGKLLQRADHPLGYQGFGGIFGN